MKLVECRACKQTVSSSAKTCPHCGQPRPAQSSHPLALAIILLLGVVGPLWLFGAIADHGKRIDPIFSTSPSPAQASPTARHFDMTVQIGAQERGPIWRRLRSTYPDIPEGEKAVWRDIQGLTHVAIPDPFWGRLSGIEKKQLAAELDTLLETTSWEIVTGRYSGSGKMMLDVGHCRSEVLGDSK